MKRIEKTKDLYELGMHRTARVDNYLEVTRVPGGWIYTREASAQVYSPAHESYVEAVVSVSQVFVPFSKEGLARGLE